MSFLAHPWTDARPYPVRIQGRPHILITVHGREAPSAAYEGPAVQFFPDMMMVNGAFRTPALYPRYWGPVEPGRGIGRESFVKSGEVRVVSAGAGWICLKPAGTTSRPGCFQSLRRPW